MDYKRFLVGAALALGACGGSNPLGGDGGVLGGGNSMKVGWDVYGVGTMSSTMKALNCDDPLASIRNVAIVVSNMGGQTASSSFPCPAGVNFGDATINTPDQNGGFALTATPDGGKATAYMHTDFDIPFADDQFTIHLTAPFNDG